MAKWFAGHRLPKDAYNSVHYETVDPKEKIAAFLKYRSRPFSDEDMVEEAYVYQGNLGFEIDSNIRNILRMRLVAGGERQTHGPDCRRCCREDAPEPDGELRLKYL
nr:hypothetical protein [Candidatus Njordarchaeota archaeon]